MHHLERLMSHAIADQCILEQSSNPASPIYSIEIEYGRPSTCSINFLLVSYGHLNLIYEILVILCRNLHCKFVCNYNSVFYKSVKSYGIGHRRNSL